MNETGTHGAMTVGKKLEDDDFLRICLAEIAAAAGGPGSDTQERRDRAVDYYFGDMDKHLPAEDGRSSAVSRTVLQVVEGILPSLVRVFVEADNLVSFRASSAADEEQARHESEVVRHIFFQENAGFLLLYQFLKDAILEGLGIFKCWWEEPEWDEETYDGLTGEQVTELLTEPGYLKEVWKQELNMLVQDENGLPTYDLGLRTLKKAGCVRVVCIPPSEFGISDGANSPNPKDANFLFHVRERSLGELAAEGYDVDLLRTIPDALEDRQANVAAWRDRGVFANQSIHWSMQTARIYECYATLDADGDKELSLWCITLAANSRLSAGKILERRRQDSSYISSATPIITPHRFYGQAPADLVTELQEIQSQLWRNELDNGYYANNGGGLAINDLVNVGDAMVSRPGRVVRVEGQASPGEAITPIPYYPLPPTSMALHDVIQREIRQRSGVGEEMMGLDAAALANTNTGVMLKAYDIAHMRLELIARLLAETGLKELFRDIHELARKHQDIPAEVKLRSGWTSVRPMDWRERVHMDVEVGVGHHTNERTLIALRNVQDIQKMLAEGGGLGTILQPENIYSLAVDVVKALGKDPDRYFTDPRKVPPQPPKPPPPEVILATAQARLLDAQAQSLPQKDQTARDIAAARLEAQKVQEQTQTVRSIGEAQWREAQTQIDQQRLVLDQYKAELAALTQLVQQSMDNRAKQEQQVVDNLLAATNIGEGP